MINGCADSTRTCIIVKGFWVETVPKHCSRDLVTARIEFSDVDGKKVFW